MNKMLNEPSEAEDSPGDEDDEEGGSAPVKGRATGKDLVPSETHPLDHIIEIIIADRMQEKKPASVKKKLTSAAK